MTAAEGFIPYTGTRYSDEDRAERSQTFFSWMDARRSVRDFSTEPVAREVIENCIRAASTAPSGAHKQPWTFCLVSKDNMELRKQIREAAEVEERENYSGRMSERWRSDLRPLGTDAVKPFLEEAPWLVIVFKRAFEIEDGKRHNNYYVNESVGLAAGFFLAAVHNVGLVALTHTPNKPKNGD